MALNSLPVSGQDLCCAGELDLSRNLPQVPSPVHGGQVLRCLQLQGCPLCVGEYRTVQPFRSWWFGLSWMLAGFLHSRVGME